MVASASTSVGRKGGFEIVRDIVNNDVARLVAQVPRPLQPQAGSDQQGPVLALAQPLRAVRDEFGAGLEVGPVLVDPTA